MPAGQVLVIGLEEAYPLWMLSMPNVGGLGWGTLEIGKVRTRPVNQLEFDISCFYVLTL